MTDTSFAVQSGSDATLELTLSRAAELTGGVLNADSLPAVGAIVVLIPRAPGRDLKHKYKWVRTDQTRCTGSPFEGGDQKSAKLTLIETPADSSASN